MEQYKTCTTCKQIKLLSEFGKDKSKKSGLTTNCLSCRRLIANARIANNPDYREKLRIQSRDYYHANKEASKTRNRKWVEANRNRRREIDSRFRSNNRQKQVERMRKYRQANPDMRKNWGRNNPDKEAAIRSRRSGALQNGKVYRITAKEITRLYNSPCLYCGSPSQHIDHIIPISRGGEHRIGNLTGACAPCNLSKGSKFITEWKRG